MLTALCFALVAVVWAVVLVDDGMLLAPVQKRVREWHRRWYMRRWLVAGDAESGPQRYADNTEQLYWQNSNNLDARWWWKPLWGCAKCVAGQLALWGVPLLSWLWHTAYDPIIHLVNICASIYLAAILTKIYTWTQS